MRFLWLLPSSRSHRKTLCEGSLSIFLESCWDGSNLLALSQVPGPGQLFKALSVFALRDVDLTKIESRPVREGSSRQFDYLFYLDLVGGMGDHVIQNALRQLQVCTQHISFLGTILHVSILWSAASKTALLPRICVGLF